jgi:hypothetical protein
MYAKKMQIIMDEKIVTRNDNGLEVIIVQLFFIIGFLIL